MRISDWSSDVCSSDLPGSGFLSENPKFASMVEEHGFVFIGPSPDHLRLMGDKVAAKDAARALGLPVVPGSPCAVDNDVDAMRLADDVGYPVLVKAAAGGRGKGMKVERTTAEIAPAVQSELVQVLRRAQGGAFVL